MKTAKIIQVVRNLPTGLRVQFDNKNFENGDTIAYTDEHSLKFKYLVGSHQGLIYDIRAMQTGGHLKQDLEFTLDSRPGATEKEMRYPTYRVGRDPFEGLDNDSQFFMGNKIFKK